MKVVIIGGAGTIGKKVAAGLAEKHEVVVAGRSSGSLRLDIADPASIEEMYETAGDLDAVVCVAGEAKWAPLAEMTDEDFQVGIRSKMMGQVQLVRKGMHRLRPGGSFTLTTGILADDPVLQVTSPAMVNGAIHSFVRAAALELPRGMRVNAVSAGLVEDSAETYADYFPGHNPIPMAKVVNAYIRAIEGRMTGQVITVYDNR